MTVICRKAKNGKCHIPCVHGVPHQEEFTCKLGACAAGEGKKNCIVVRDE